MPFYKNKKIILGVIGLGIALFAVFIIVFLIMSKPLSAPTLPPVSEPISAAVEPVSEPVVPVGSLEVENSENFTKRVTVLDENCPIIAVGMEVYDLGNNYKLIINRKALDTTSRNIIDYNNVISFFKGEKKIDDLVSSGGQVYPFEIFSLGCSGFASFHTEGYPIHYPGTDKAILIPSFDTQTTYTSIPDLFTIRVYGIKGEDILEASKVYNGNEFFSQEDADSCKETTQYGYMDINLTCLINKFDSDTAMGNLLIQKAKEDLVDVFVLKK